MGRVNVIIVDATGNKEQKVGLPDDIKCGIIMVKLVEKIKLPSVGLDGNPISYKFIHKVTGRQLLESQTLGEAGIKDGDVLRLQPEITAGAVCSKCGNIEMDGDAFCSKCGSPLNAAVAPEAEAVATPVAEEAPAAAEPVPEAAPVTETVNTAAFTQGPAYGTYNSSAPKAMPAINAAQIAGTVKQKFMSNVSCAIGIISGIISVIFGIITLGMDTGSWESSSSYGGDAYTGIQNAAAQTANNVQDLAEIVAAGIGFLLIAMGLIAVSYFLTKMKTMADRK